MIKWTKFETSLPTKTRGQQVQIFLYSPWWATFLRGLYTHFPGVPLEQRLATYNQQDDYYIEWDNPRPPIYWAYAPRKEDMPKEPKRPLKQINNEGRNV